MQAGISKTKRRTAAIAPFEWIGGSARQGLALGLGPIRRVAPAATKPSSPTSATTTTSYIGNHYEVSGGVITKHYSAGGQRVAMRRGSEWYYLFTDHLGSTSATWKIGSALLEQQGYKPWGEVRTTATNDLDTNYTYTGQMTEEAIGLMYYNARWYDSSLGRFVQADSIVPLASQGTQAWDRFAYVNNSPVNFSDPSGHDSVCGYSYSDPECKTAFAPVIWTKLPVEDADWLQYYGNTKYAYESGKNYDYHKFAEGMHPGLDFGRTGKSVPIVAGFYGTVISDLIPSPYGPGYFLAVARIGDYYRIVLYGHLMNSQVRIGDELTPETIIGYTQYPGYEHVHFELWTGMWSGMENPLPYFSKDLQIRISEIATEQDRSKTEIDGIYFQPNKKGIWQTPYEQPKLKRTFGNKFIEAE